MSPGFVLRIALGVATLVPPAAIVLAVAAYARNMPWRDQWGLIPFMAEAVAGRFPPAMLWAEVNEHRIPVAMLLQGAIAWVTRWDVRGDAWANVAIALGTLAALAALCRRTLGPTAAACTTVVCSVLAFSPIAGASWTAGWITPAYLAAFFAALLAWLLARSSGTAFELGAMIGVAVAGALSFGTGLLLVLLLPLGVLLRPGPLERRVLHALVALAVAAALAWIYVVGWVPRPGAKPPVFSADRLDDYADYALVYVGRAVGAVGLTETGRWGAGMLGVLVAAGLWVWSRRPGLRAALVPWGLLALFGIGNGLVTAYGRIDSGAHTALLPRYMPTAGLFVASVGAVVTLLVGDVLARSRLAGVALLAAVAIALLVVAPRFTAAARGGVDEMRTLARHLDENAPCLASCATATDLCLERLCWSAKVARDLCPVMEGARIGPFR